MIFIIIISDSNDDHYNDCVINDRSVPRVTCLGATTFNKNYAFIKKVHHYQHHKRRWQSHIQ